MARGRNLEDSKTIKINWETYVTIRRKAMTEDLTIAEAVDELLDIDSDRSEKYTESTKQKSTEKFECEECGKEFDTKKELSGHMLGAHKQSSGRQGSEKEEDSAPYVCSNCGREFDTKRGLSLHQNYCGKSASQRPRAKSNE